MLYKGKEKLEGVHPNLVKVALRAGEITGEHKFNVAEGPRTKERQAQMLKEGKSKTMNSKHCLSPSHAIDIYPISPDGKQILWGKADFDVITNAFKQAAKELDVKIVCGTDWTKFVDRPHIELA